VVLGTDFIAEIGFFTIGELVEDNFEELVLGTVCSFPEIFFGFLMLSVLDDLDADADLVTGTTLLFVEVFFVGLVISFGINVGLEARLGADFVVLGFLLIVGTILVGLEMNCGALVVLGFLLNVGTILVGLEMNCGALGALFVTGSTLMIVGTIFVGLEINLTSSADGTCGFKGRWAFSVLGKFGLFLIGGRAGASTSGV